MEFKAIDYKNYESKARSLINGLRSPLQLSSRYLSNWGKFERNISTLSDNEIEMAKDLFSSLKLMTEKERNFLASKYRAIVPTKQSIPDREMAKKYNIEMKEYAKIRKAIEFKFFCYLYEQSEHIQNMLKQRY